MTPKERRDAIAEITGSFKKNSRFFHHSSAREEQREWEMAIPLKVIKSGSDRSDKCIARLLSRACSGDREAHDVLVGIAGRLIEGPISLPLSLQEYLVKIVQGRGPVWRRGRRKRTFLWRDYRIHVAVRFIAATYSIQPTRNREAKPGDCACSIVSDALNLLGLKNERGGEFSETAVAEIWNRRDR